MGRGQSSWLQRQKHRAWEVGAAVSRHFPWLPGASSPSAGATVPHCSWVSPSAASRHCSHVLVEKQFRFHTDNLYSPSPGTQGSSLSCFQTSKGSPCQGGEPQILSLLL